VDPVVFIHFTKSTIRGIQDGSDALLIPFLEEYHAALRGINPEYHLPPMTTGAKPAEKRNVLLNAFQRFKRKKK
jgi:hypothetical protein